MSEQLRAGTALAAFNAPGFDAMVGICTAAAVIDHPVIIQVSARLVKKHGTLPIKSWFDAVKKITSAQSYLHLDHCHDDNILRACILSGWDMVMYDGSHMPIDENCARTKEISEFAHKHGVAVEGEVGAIGGEEDGYEADANYARNEDIIRLSQETGIDCIAVGFGNVHGDYTNKANLRWDIYEGAHRLSGLPLVLHGGSGLTDAEFQRAIQAGSTKINISTELKKAYSNVLSDPELSIITKSDPAALHMKITEAVQSVAQAHIQLFAQSSKRKS
jgi:fructose-bisphosphate aldolase class II